MRIQSLAAAICFLTAAPSWAISNIESQRPGALKEGFSGQLSVGLSGKTGDKREEDYTFNARLNYRQDKNLFFVIGSHEYGSTRTIKDTDEAFIHGRWMHSFNAKWAGEAFTQWEEDEFANLESRTLLGGGARYLTAHKENVYILAIGLGAFREHETLDLSTYKQDTNTWRINAYYSYSHNLNKNTSIASTTYLQPSSDNFDDVRVLFTFSLDVKMTDSLKLSVGYQAKHDSQPAKNLAADPIIDNNKTNTEYSTTLSYQF